LKNDLRERQDLLRYREKLVKEDHPKIIIMEEKCRKLTYLMKNSSRVIEQYQPEQPMNFEDLEMEIKKLEEVKTAEEESFKKKLRKLKMDNKEADAQYGLLTSKLMEKRQESRLDDLTIRELKRSIPHKTLKPLYTARTSIQNNNRTPLHHSSPLKITRGKINTPIFFSNVSQSKLKIKKNKYSRNK
jgi:hypothetical protein